MKYPGVDWLRDIRRKVRNETTVPLRDGPFGGRHSIRRSSMAYCSRCVSVVPKRKKANKLDVTPGIRFRMLITELLTEKSGPVNEAIPFTLS